MARGKFILRMTHIVNLGLPRQSDPSKIDNICVCIVFIFNLLVSHNRLQENPFEQKRKISSRVNGTYGFSFFLSI